MTMESQETHKSTHATDVICGQIPQNFLGLQACALKPTRPTESIDISVPLKL
jgi:hypothetical protein